MLAAEREECASARFGLAGRKKAKWMSHFRPPRNPATIDDLPSK